MFECFDFRIVTCVNTHEKMEYSRQLKRHHKSHTILILNSGRANDFRELNVAQTQI